MLLAGALLPAACSGASGPQATTTTSATAIAAPAELPLARTEVASAVLDGRIVVAGGLTADGGASDRVDVYDPATNSWQPGPALPLGLHHSGMAALDGRVYVAGGYANRAGQDWVAQSRVVSLGPNDRAWREEAALGGTRGGLAVAGIAGTGGIASIAGTGGTAAAAGRLVAVGGTDNLGRFLARTEVFTPGQRAWTAGPDMIVPWGSSPPATQGRPAASAADVPPLVSCNCGSARQPPPPAGSQDSTVLRLLSSDPSRPAMA